METAIAPQVCKSCGSTGLPDGKFCLFCGDLLNPAEDDSGKLQSSDNIRAVVSPIDPNDYAGFWLRVWAGLIDVTLEVMVALLLSLAVDAILHTLGRPFGIAPESMSYVTGITFIVLLSIGGWLYSAFSESSRYRATLGKRFLGLQVVNADGGTITFGQASVRHFMKFLSLFTLAFGFIMVSWTKRRQALHDMPSDSLVIRTPEQTLSLFGDKGRN